MKIKTALVTGGTGTWGQEIVKQLLAMGVNKIIVYSRAERSQEAMKMKLRDNRVEYVLGDVCDYHRIKKVMRGVDTVFHTAAIKAVPNMETDCMYGFNININGTANVVNAAIANGIKQFVFTSTDKAVNPINAYGVSKLACEHIIQQAARDYPKIKFRIVRSGNVLGSSSSVLHVWKRSIQETNSLKITDPLMTRFYIPVQQAVEGLFEALDGKGVLHANLSKNASLETLSRAAIKLWGNDDTRIEIIGNRGNEKLHEQILNVYDGASMNVFSNDTAEYTVDELVEIIKDEGI